MKIRRLPTVALGPLVETAAFPPNTALFNPSAAGDYIYIRATQHTATDEQNSIILHHEPTKTTRTLANPNAGLAPTANLFKGLEDLRLAMWRGRLWFTATTTHASAAYNNEMVCGVFAEGMDRIERMSPLALGPLPVKNVVPFADEARDVLCLLDTWRATIYDVVEVRDEEDPEVFVKFALSKRRELTPGSGMPTEKFRGSTSPIRLHGNTWGFVVHNIIFNDNTGLTTRLAYYHHYVEADFERGRITFFSAPFWIAHWGIEYVSGLRKVDADADADRGLVELYFGIDDTRPMKAVVRLSDLRVGK